ncbi:MAG: CHASE2 domain-containing protein [Burkholderiales bacterium]|nr:CHASE2 domain-containing protein [Burkholderiales bacterium]
MTAAGPVPTGAGHIRGVGVAVLLLLVALAWLETPWHRRLQFAWFDACQTLSPRRLVELPATVVQIDEKALAELGQWPWPRSVMARLIDAIDAHQPSAIGIDVIMAEPDRWSPARLADQIGADAETRARLLALPDTDAQLAEALARAPVVLGIGGLPDTTGAPVRAPPVLVRGGDPQKGVRTFAGVLASTEVLDRAAPGHGLLSSDLEGGVVRRMPLIGRIGETWVPGFSMEMLRLASGARGVVVHADGARVKSVAVADVVVPTDADGAVWVHFSPRDGRPRVSAADVLAGRADKTLLASRMVLVGATGLGLLDYQTAASGERMPGIEVHAQVLESVFDGAILLRPHWMRWIEIMLLACAGIVLVAAVPVFSPRRSVLLIGAAVAGAGILSLGLFRDRHLLLDAATPSLALVILFGALLALTLAAATRRERALEREVQRQREEAARVAGELEAARRIQTGILPRPDALAGETRVEVACEMTPAREVGGDLYDFFALDRDRLFFLIGDVSGKGLPASIFMAVSKALYKSNALRRGGAAADAALIGELMTRANAEVARENSEAMFVTLFAGILDLGTGVLAYCNAGHDDPTLVGANGALTRLRGGDGPPLCVVDDFSYAGTTATLAPGDLLCLVTDGVTEAQDRAGRLYGGVRLAAVLAALPGAGLGAAAARERIHADVALFVGGAEPADDLTILTVRWNGG